MTALPPEQRAEADAAAILAAFVAPPGAGTACSFVEVSRFIGPQWLVEFEVDVIAAD